MDALELLADTARPLLAQVDDTLAQLGAPPEHPVWPVLRHVRLLPGAAVEAVAALTASAVSGRFHGREIAEAAAALPGPGEWSGDAADAYDTARRRLAGDLSDLAERVDALAAFVESVADWMVSARGAVAAVLAEEMASGSAVVLLAAGHDAVSERSRAAADIGGRVLEAVADVYRVADMLLDRATALPRG